MPELPRPLKTGPGIAREIPATAETKRVNVSGRAREALKSIGISLGIALVTLAALEIVLRVADFRELRETLSETSLAYDFDAELGWMPVPNSGGTVQSFRTTHYKHNRPWVTRRGTWPAMVSQPSYFSDDSFVWGSDFEADERFSDLLKPRIPDYRIFAAGVSGFGTDQEYLLLQRIWPKVKPAVVVLIFCSDNDRRDNERSI